MKKLGADKKGGVFMSIDDILLRLNSKYGFRLNSKGTLYLSECILAIVENRYNSCHMTSLYKDIATKYNSNYKAVERVARNQVSKLDKHFPVLKKHFTVGEFCLRESIKIVVEMNHKKESED